MALCIVLVLTTACSLQPAEGAKAPAPSQHTHAHECETSPAPEYLPTPEVAELDKIYTLLAYSVVYKDWQRTGWQDPERARGYNIGGILVDPARPTGEQLLCWARNSVITTRNGTQHGEVRLITNYLGNAKQHKLKGLKLYTTLEPCAMCSGMMTLQQLQTTIYGQTDPGFGKALERLSLDSSHSHGYCPYPRSVQSVRASNRLTNEIDATFARHGGNIVEWLASSEAEALYRAANQQLKDFRVTFPGNAAALENALEFLEKIPDSYTATPYTTACEG